MESLPARRRRGGSPEHMKKEDVMISRKKVDKKDPKRIRFTDPLFEYQLGEMGLPSVREESDSDPRRIEPRDGEARKERGTGGGGSGAKDSEGKGKARVARRAGWNF
jgi:hypothetical protein